ncbi:MAG: hypothetical protein HZA90_21050 [Verrucomicrobia bacterium]|nr:hypothetical protein [Verrucomicrobiota bacterium]
MRRRLIIGVLVVAVALFITLAVFLRPPPPAGQFPAKFSDAEKRQIVAAANRDALRQTLRAIGRGQLVGAKRWMLNSRKQTVRLIGQQEEGKIWVHFGVADPTATDGYAIWARYIMKRDNGHWVIDKPLF